MKRVLLNYYLGIVFILFVILNLAFYNVRVSGLFYILFYDILFILNILVIVRYRESIKFKVPVMIGYLFVWIFCKDVYYLAFDIVNVILLGIIGMVSPGFVRIFSFIIMGIILCFLPFIFIYNILGNDDIYEDTHYFCDGNYEIYSYSSGAFDGFHYSIDQHYEFINVDGIIEIDYRERSKVSLEEYNDFLKTHSCKLVGD